MIFPLTDKEKDILKTVISTKSKQFAEDKERNDAILQRLEVLHGKH